MRLPALARHFPGHPAAVAAPLTDRRTKVRSATLAKAITVEPSRSGLIHSAWMHTPWRTPLPLRGAGTLGHGRPC